MSIGAIEATERPVSGEGMPIEHAAAQAAAQATATGSGPLISAIALIVTSVVSALGYQKVREVRGVELRPECPINGRLESISELAACAKRASERMETFCEHVETDHERAHEALLQHAGDSDVRAAQMAMQNAQMLQAEQRQIEILEAQAVTLGLIADRIQR